MLVSTTRMLSRTSSTVCWSEMTPVSSRGAAPNTTTSSGSWAERLDLAGRTSRRSRGCRPARSARPTSGPGRSGRRTTAGRVAIRPVAAVLSAPVELRSASAARRREGGMPTTVVALRHVVGFPRSPGDARGGLPQVTTSHRRRGAWGTGWIRLWLNPEPVRQPAGGRGAPSQQPERPARHRARAPPRVRADGLGTRAAAAARPRLRPHDVGTGHRVPGAHPHRHRAGPARPRRRRTSRAPTTASAATPTGCATC